MLLIDTSERQKTELVSARPARPLGSSGPSDAECACGTPG